MKDFHVTKLFGVTFEQANKTRYLNNILSSLLNLTKEIKAISRVTGFPLIRTMTSGAIAWSWLQSRAGEGRKGESLSVGSLAQRSQGTNFVSEVAQWSIL